MDVVVIPTYLKIDGDHLELRRATLDVTIAAFTTVEVECKITCCGHICDEAVCRILLV